MAEKKEYKITRGKYYRRDPETREMERYATGDNVLFTEAQARRFGKNRLEMVDSNPPEKKRELKTQPAGKGDSSPPATGASPAAIKYAQEKGIDITEVKGTGKNNTVTKDDVKRHLRAINDGQQD